MIPAVAHTRASTVPDRRKLTVAATTAATRQTSSASMTQSRRVGSEKRRFQ